MKQRPMIEMQSARRLLLFVVFFVATNHGDVTTVAVFGDDTKLPNGVVNTQDPKDISLTPVDSLKRITVPEGFQVTLFAGEPNIRRPIAFDFDDRGRLWVVENYAHPKWHKDNRTDRIVILEDSNGDGAFDQRKVFWDKGRYLSAIALGHGGVWIGNTPELSFIPDKNGDDVPDSEPIVMLDGFAISSNNVLNNFHWGPDGWLYGAIGLSAASLVGPPQAKNEDRTRITRGIWRFHPVKHRFEKLAEGMVNPWGADFNEFGDLITSNTVLAHLWHIVPGMYCQRRANEGDYRYAYGRIQSITNHLHWGGGQWQSSRANHKHHSVAGGGHAHCGGMIYLGDNWPARYRGTFFTNNLHGNRVNNDRLVSRGSSYVGVHSDDFLFGNDPWFRGLSIRYGKDGAVYISDWHDIGECHDSDGSHRTSGRIYKVKYSKQVRSSQRKSSFEHDDLAKLSDGELAELHVAGNVWLVRHARRILHERALKRPLQQSAIYRMKALFREPPRLDLDTNGRVTQDEVDQLRLRAFWTLKLVSPITQPHLVQLLDDRSPHVRRWAIRFLADDLATGSGTIDRKLLQRLALLAKQDSSPKVRLELACLLQRIPINDRIQVLAELTKRIEDVDDDYIPLMTWYAFEPVVKAVPHTAIQVAAASQFSHIRRFAVRRALEADVDYSVSALLELAIASKSDAARLDILNGVLDSTSSGKRRSPTNWSDIRGRLMREASPDVRSVAIQLAVQFGDQTAIQEFRKRVMDETSSNADRLQALQAIIHVDRGLTIDDLHELLQLSGKQATPIRKLVLQRLTLTNNEMTPTQVLKNYGHLTVAERQDAISVLTTQLKFAQVLVEAIERKQIDQQDVSSFAVQQLRAFNNDTLNAQIEKLWATDTSKLQKSKEIARLKKLLTSEFVASGNASHGRELFEATCAKCHTLFGEGAQVGPDLTGSGRKKLDYVLSNLIDPSAVIDEKYRLSIAITNKGRLHTGFIIHQDDRFVVIRTQQSEVRLGMKDVDELRTLPQSMMPENMLKKFNNNEVRDLVKYLASDDQVSRVSE